jgi:hypothetical protein
MITLNLTRPHHCHITGTIIGEMWQGGLGTTEFTQSLKRTVAESLSETLHKSGDFSERWIRDAQLVLRWYVGGTITERRFDLEDSFKAISQLFYQLDDAAG